MDDSNTSAGAPVEPAPPAAGPRRRRVPTPNGRPDGDDAAGTALPPSAAGAARAAARTASARDERDRRADARRREPCSAQPDELPEPIREGRVTDPEAADKALVRKPKIGDTRAPFVPAMPPPGPAVVGKAATGAGNGSPTAKPAGGNRKRRRGGGAVLGPTRPRRVERRPVATGAQPTGSASGGVAAGRRPVATPVDARSVRAAAWARAQRATDRALLHVRPGAARAWPRSRCSRVAA